uniref:SHSP domain-containing protein n=1 Tax=Parascaris univalens TaxID=6257 RepID=A0A915C8R7_PARUN
MTLMYPSVGFSIIFIEFILFGVVFQIVDNAEKFQVEVDVTQFRPNELSVNVRDHELVIEGHHQERSDQVGSIERHFVRKYSLPHDVQASAFESRLSDSGLLTVFAPKSNAPAGRSIPIQAAPTRNSSRRAR